MRFLVLMMVVMSACGLQPVEELGPASSRPAEPVEPVVERVEPQMVMTAVARTRTFRGPIQSGDRQRVLSDKTSRVALALNDETVFCSAIGYGVSFLKVSVPDLDWLAHFNHRANTLGLPCAAAGECTDLLNPESILQSRPGVEAVDVRVVLTEVLRVDVEPQRCSRWMTESVEAKVRGLQLRHHVDGTPEDVPFERCQVLASLAQE